MTRRQKRRMVQFAGGMVSVLCMGMVLGTVYAEQQTEPDRGAVWNTEEEIWENTSEEAGKDTKEARKTAQKDTEEEAVFTEDRILEERFAEEQLPEDWNLKLVNSNHYISDEYQVELKEIGSGHKIDARAYEDFRAMIKAAKRDGVYIYVTSSYRDMAKQTELHENKIESLVMEGYSYAEAKKKAAEVVAIPGTSEHQLGLALDMVSSEYRKLDERQEETRGFKWLKEHCAEYGFILRYPNGKTEWTGIIYEPWHFRYVGREAAQEIMEQGITLEEYLGAAPAGIPAEEETEKRS